MRTYFKIFFALYACVFAQSWAAAGKVLKVGRDQINVAVSHDSSRKPWREKENVCIFQSGKSVVCGAVVRTSPKGAILKLEKASTEVSAGDEVRGGRNVALSARGGKRSRRRPAAAIMGTGAAGGEAASSFNLSAGLNAGLSYFYPSVNLQMRLGKNMAVGIVPLYLSAAADTTKLTAMGGFATFNYYFDGYFRGLWLQGGGGYVMFSTSDELSGLSESVGSPAGIGTLGWRGYWDFGLNIGVAAGFQYITPPVFTETEVKSAGVQPLFLLDIGVNF